MIRPSAVPAGYVITEVDPTTASDALVRGIVELTWAVEREHVPEDPDRPADAIAQRFRATSPFFERRQWGAFAGEQLVAGVTLGRNLTGTNAQHREVSVNVHPEHRRHGLGRALFARAVEAIGEDDGVVINAFTSDRVPAGGAFAARVGAKPGLRMRTSQLELASIDRARMREWATLDPLGYRIVWILDRVPDELMDNVIEALHAINRMPREDLELEDWKFTPEIVRDSERQMTARGQRHWIVLALHESGVSAGFTDIAFDPRTPHVVHQRGTAVAPEHQGKGIGKWMKARMVEKILADLPEARHVRTDNAGTNAAMLGINVGMGYAPAWENVIWQLAIADARRYAARPAFPS